MHTHSLQYRELSMASSGPKIWTVFQQTNGSSIWKVSTTDVTEDMRKLQILESTTSTPL